MGYTKNMGKKRNKKGKLQQIYENGSGEEQAYDSSHEIKWGKLDNTLPPAGKGKSTG